jgi:hypothetical protein
MHRPTGLEVRSGWDRSPNGADVDEGNDGLRTALALASPSVTELVSWPANNRRTGRTVIGGFVPAAYFFDHIISDTLPRGASQHLKLRSAHPGVPGYSGKTKAIPASSPCHDLGVQAALVAPPPGRRAA